MSINRKYLRRKYSSRAYRMKRRLRTMENLLVYLGTVIVLLALIFFVRQNFFSQEKKLRVKEEDVAAFRIPYGTFKELRVLAEGYKLDFADLLALYSMENEFFPAKDAGAEASPKKELAESFEDLKKMYAKNDLSKYSEMFGNILGELECFPIPTGFEGYEPDMYMYGDSWGRERTYDGDRLHQGTDIFDRENIRGRIPVVSMTAGVIEDLGWNELGGYSVGIRTGGGSYYYYAHLDGYAEELVKGGAVKAGQFLGYMGDSGYGKQEGTKGNFQVHLHVGISPDVAFGGKEFWINPYIFLRQVEDRRIEFERYTEGKADVPTLPS